MHRAGELPVTCGAPLWTLSTAALLAAMYQRRYAHPKELCNGVTAHRSKRGGSGLQRCTRSPAARAHCDRSTESCACRRTSEGERVAARRRRAAQESAQQPFDGGCSSAALDGQLSQCAALHCTHSDSHPVTLPSVDRTLSHAAQPLLLLFCRGALSRRGAPHARERAPSGHVEVSHSLPLPRSGCCWSEVVEPHGYVPFPGIDWRSDGRRDGRGHRSPDAYERTGVGTGNGHGTHGSDAWNAASTRSDTTTHACSDDDHCAHSCECERRICRRVFLLGHRASRFGCPFDRCCFLLSPRSLRGWYRAPASPLAYVERRWW